LSPPQSKREPHQGLHSGEEEDLRPSLRQRLLLCHETLLQLAGLRGGDGDRFIGARNKAIALLFLDTGLRLSELTNIQLADIDFDREIIRVMGKDAKERVVRFGKTIQKALLKYLLLRKDDHPCLWVTEERRPMAREGIKMVVKRLCQRAGVTGVKPGAHTFRHTAAINNLRNGDDLFTLQCMLGHSTLEITRRYTSSLGAEDMIRVHKQASKGR